MKLTMLGTGNALVTECYNTCFVLEENGEYFMVDGGGGNGVLRQLKSAGLDWKAMRHIFVTHKHLDHITGVMWMVRMICQAMARGDYEGEAVISSHKEVLEIIADMAEKLLTKKQARFVGDRLKLKKLHDGDTVRVIGRETTFFDIDSTKAKQYGFCMDLGNGRRLTCCGDEPYSERERPYVLGSDWLLHEAFCLYDQRDIFDPYEKHHSTVRDACETAERLKVKNLVLYHTEDRTIAQRKKLYTEEGRRYFSGGLYVPDDLETIDLG